MTGSPIIVPIRARTLVLTASGERLLELPLDLSPGQDLRLVE